ncbi:MAG: hypothetical protein AB7U85_10885 [Alphaproteobacteria bacterium]
MSIFKIYSKDRISNQSDTIFTIIGKSEPDLTKSLAYLLYYSKDFLNQCLTLIDSGIDLKYINSIVAAEQKPDIGLDNNRRDISIMLKYLDSTKNSLIVIEAKNLYLKKISSNSIIKQLTKYFNRDSFSDVKRAKSLIGVTLTKDKLLFDQTNAHGLGHIVSIQWQDIIGLLMKSKDFMLQSFKQEIMNSNFIKTYEEEVFCPPVGDTYKKVKELNIYCCPADRSLKDAIYLLPRIPVNKNSNVLKTDYNYTDDEIKTIKGKGFSIALYKIDNSFIVDLDSIDAIEDQTLKEKVNKWGIKKGERLKVFILSEKMDFEKPKITDLQNNAWNGYFKLSDIWGNLIKKNTNAQHAV